MGIRAERRQNTKTPVETARAEDPLCEVVFFTQLAEAVPKESEVFCRSDFKVIRSDVSYFMTFLSQPLFL